MKVKIKNPLKSKKDTELELELEKILEEMSYYPATTKEYEELTKRYDEVWKLRYERKPRINWDVPLKLAGIAVTFVGTVVVPVAGMVYAYHKEEEECELPNGRVFSMAEKRMMKNKDSIKTE